MPIPVQSHPFNAGGPVDPVWLEWLRTLEQGDASSNAELATQISAIATALGSPDGTAANIPPQTDEIARLLQGDGISITGDGSTGSPYIVSLVGSALVVFNTAAQFTADDKILPKGIFGKETDTGFLKIGDGVTRWTALGYYDAAAIPYDPTTSGLSATDVQAAVDELAAAIGDGAIGCTFDGGGAALTVGAFVDVQAPFDATINAATLVGDPSGSLVISVWKDVLANYPPTSGDNIAASAPPTLSSAAHSRDTSLTGWTKTITKGDVLRFTVQSCSSITRASLALEVTKD